MNITELYNEIDDKEKNHFDNNLTSNLQVTRKEHKTSYDDSWLTKMEGAIKYIDNILRNPNRFIVNEEEIVKIELARRITVESIKHLSRNTNFIQEYDAKTGEVKPSKILNINKEESFNTYENRFIFTLINNMKMYVERKKNENISASNSDSNISLVYQGSSKISKNNIEMNLTISEKSKASGNSTDELLERITKIEEEIKNLTGSYIYKNLAKLHVAPVVSPIKKTNLILKNVNFQYALDLWNYLQSHMEASTKQESINKKYNDNSKLKEMMDESFILNYKIMETLKENKDSKEVKEVENKVINNAINQLMSLKDELSLDDIVKLIGDEYVKVKTKKVLDTSEISKAYKEAVSDYMEKEHELKVVR